MEKQKLLKEVRDLNKHKIVERDSGEVLSFENDGKTFDIFRKVLDPGNDWTYRWLHELFNLVLDIVESDDLTSNGQVSLYKLEDYLREHGNEFKDRTSDVYTSELLRWLSCKISNTRYISKVLEKYDLEDGNNLLKYAQDEAIDELYREAVPTLIEHLTTL